MDQLPHKPNTTKTILHYFNRGKSDIYYFNQGNLPTFKCQLSNARAGYVNYSQKTRLQTSTKSLEKIISSARGLQKLYIKLIIGYSSIPCNCIINICQQNSDFLTSNNPSFSVMSLCFGFLVRLCFCLYLKKKASSKHLYVFSIISDKNECV